MPTALVTGLSGQDGFYLARWLLTKGYRVVGLSRAAAAPAAPFPTEGVFWRQGDLGSEATLCTLLEEVRPDEVYNLAGITFSPDAWSHPVEAAEVMALGVVRLLEAIRRVAPRVRFFQASSAEMFGRPERAPQDEFTPVRPVTPYGAAKALAHFQVAAYRERYGLHASCGFLFSHESPLRRPEFVVRKVAVAAARISRGLDRQVTLGNLDATRDWTYAGDVVRAMWAMLQRPAPGDFVVASGTSHTVRELCAAAFGHVGIAPEPCVVADHGLARPEETVLCGDIGKARRELAWSPALSFADLVALMVDAELARLDQRAVRL